MSATETSSSTIITEPISDSDAPLIEIGMSDRSIPVWAGFLSSVFAICSGVCLLAVAIGSIYFSTLVAQRGELIVAPLLVAFGAVPILGAVVLDYSFGRALAGYREMRTGLYRRAQGYLALVVVIALTLIHPLLGSGPVVAVGFAGLGF